VALLAFGAALGGLLVVPISDAAAAAAGLAVAVLLVVLGYREARWRALRWVVIVPAAAITADVITFTPLSLQTGPEADIYSYGALFYVPLYALLIGLGVAGARVSWSARHPET